MGSLNRRRRFKYMRLLPRCLEGEYTLKLYERRESESRGEAKFGL